MDEYKKKKNAKIEFNLWQDVSRRRTDTDFYSENRIRSFDPTLAAISSAKINNGLRVTFLRKSEKKKKHRPSIIRSDDNYGRADTDADGCYPDNLFG